MKIVRGIALAAAALAIAAPRASVAQSSFGFEVTPIVGGTLFLDDGPNRFALGRGAEEPLIVEDGKFADALTVGVNAGVRLNDHFAVEGLFSWLPTHLSAANLAESPKIDAYMYGLTGLFYVPVFTPFGPYWGLGIGAETFDYRSAVIESETHWQANFVGGMAFDVSDRFGLRIEGRDCLGSFDSGIAGVDDEWENDLMLTAGLTWRMGFAR